MKAKHYIMIIVFLFWHGVATMYIILNHTCPPPTIPRVQQLLIDEGYDLGESGVDSVAGEKTVLAWTWWSENQVERENAERCE